MVGRLAPSAAGPDASQRRRHRQDPAATPLSQQARHCPRNPLESPHRPGTESAQPSLSLAAPSRAPAAPANPRQPGDSPGPSPAQPQQRRSGLPQRPDHSEIEDQGRGRVSTSRIAPPRLRTRAIALGLEAGLSVARTVGVTITTLPRKLKVTSAWLSVRTPGLVLARASCPLR